MYVRTYVRMYVCRLSCIFRSLLPGFRASGPGSFYWQKLVGFRRFRCCLFMLTPFFLRLFIFSSPFSLCLSLSLFSFSLSLSFSIPAVFVSSLALSLSLFLSLSLSPSRFSYAWTCTHPWPCALFNLRSASLCKVRGESAFKAGADGSDIDSSVVDS